VADRDHVESAESLRRAQESTDAADLQDSLADLAGLITGAFGLPELLFRVATFAAHAIPGADGAGITLLRPGRSDPPLEPWAASAPFVTELESIQQHEGPAVTATIERRTVRSGAVDKEKVWPRFGPQAARLRVYSVLSLPLLLPDQVIGAINLYAQRKEMFDAHAAELGEKFAAAAAVAVHNAQVLSQSVELTVQLQAALSSRPIIDQAIGILRARSGDDAPDAFQRLRAISQAENRKLAIVAEHVVDEAVRRARARHSEG
jgi:GAF domain-containing protein